jgi:organic radical activating enzyme
MNAPFPVPRAARRTGSIFGGVLETPLIAARAAEATGDIEKAIEGYKLALTFDPKSTESINALGRLRFKAPPTPYLDEVRETIKTKVVTVVLEVRNPCNFRCFYCLGKGQNNTPVQEFDFEKIEAFYKTLSKQENIMIATNLECDGGEPTVHPQFAELIRLCSQYGAFSFPTNNSQDPKRWLPREKAHQIVVVSTLHPEAEEKIDRFIEYARYLIDAGCRFSAGYIGHPTRIAAIPAYRELFKKHDIPFAPVSYVGEYEGKIYPPAHTEEEQKIMGFEDEKRFWMHRIDPHVSQDRNFRGIDCLAGHLSFYLTNKGVLQRCYFDRRPIEGILEKPKACEIKKCSCGLMLEKLNLNDTGEFYNTFAKRAGSGHEPVDIEAIAKKHGYDSMNDAAYTEQKAMYDALMAAHGKNEFPEKPGKE